MSRIVILTVAVFLSASGLAQAQTAVKIDGVIAGSNLVVLTTNQGGNLVGAGKLTAPTGQGYYLKVTKGTVLQRRYVSLQGSLLTANGTVVSAFTLNGDALSGNLAFTYTGRLSVVQQAGKGVITIQY